MHTIVRAFVSSSIRLQQATDEQIDRRGAQKTLGAVWSELPRLHPQVIHVAEELFDAPERGGGSPHAEETQWLKAMIDEVATTTDAQVMDEAESWAWMTRSIGWLGFCLAQAGSYADDCGYGPQAFSEIKELLCQGDEFERALVTATISAASAHFDATGSTNAGQVAEVYDDLVRALQ